MNFECVFSLLNQFFTVSNSLNLIVIYLLIHQNFAALLSLPVPIWAAILSRLPLVSLKDWLSTGSSAMKRTSWQEMYNGIWKSHLQSVQ